MKFTVTILLILLTLFFLFPWKERGKVDIPEERGNNLSATFDSVGQGYSGKVSGKIVYQRPDGIYTINLQDGKPVRIVPYGAYPRWSPDGKRIVFVHGNKIMLTDEDGKYVAKIATADKARAVGFTSEGKTILFSDGNYLKKVDLGTAMVSTLIENNEFREFDISKSAMRLVATVRTFFGVKVYAFDLSSGTERIVSNGCSASLSPDGLFITVNDKSHTKLFLYQWQNMQRAGFVSAPEGLKFDNQFWSNHIDWIVSTSEGKGTSHDIYLHYVPSNTSFRVTSTGDCDRADLFVTHFVH